MSTFMSAFTAIAKAVAKPTTHMEQLYGQLLFDLYYLFAHILHRHRVSGAVLNMLKSISGSNCFISSSYNM